MAEAKTKERGSQELIDQTTGEVVTMDQALAAYAADVGAGFENQDSEDTGIPWLVLLQPLSPECSAEGSTAKPGMWANRGSGEVIPNPLFVAVTTTHTFREWSSSDPSGSAPVAEHAINSDLIVRVRRDQEFGKYHHPDNPEHPLVENFTVFGLAVNDGVGTPAVMSFASTGIKAYRSWMMRARSIILALPNGQKINPPLFAHVWKLSSKRVERKPNVWWVPEVGFADPAGAERSRLLPTDALYQQAKNLREMIAQGQAKAAKPQRTEAGDEDHGPRASADQEKAPY